jgi:hypothetical protein
MVNAKKKKRDFVNTIHAIERFHQRRSVFTIHITFSIAIQVAIWLNWYSSYQVRGMGFINNFFVDRLIISAALCISLIGHLVLMRLAESKDRMVMAALRRYQSDDEANLSDLQTDFDEPLDESFIQRAQQKGEKQRGKLS